MLKTIDWIRFSKFYAESDYVQKLRLDKIMFDKRGLGHARGGDGIFVIITNEMIEASHGLLKNVHIIQISNSKYDWEHTYDFSFNIFYKSILNKDVALGLYFCKNILKKTCDINLDEYNVWVMGFSDGLPRYYDFEKCNYPITSNLHCYRLIGFI